MTMHKLIQLLATLLLIVAAGALAGCGEAASTEAADDKQDGAQTAANDGGKDGDNAETDAESDDEGKEEEKTEEAVPVEVAALEVGGIESVLRFSTNLEAESEVKVFSQAKRLVTGLLVEEGDRVSKGQLLLGLQDDEQTSALAKVRSQLAKAEREYEQQGRLFAQELISEQAYRDSTYELEQLKISEQDAERELSYTEVRAPIGGTITQRMVNLGDQVQIGQHLFDMVDFNSIVARVYVPEKYLAELRKGLPARVYARAEGLRQYDVEVERISPIVDPKSGTVKVTVEVGRKRGLRPGMYVDVDLITATNAEAVLVPKRALVYDNDQMFVYRLGDERRVERVFVESRLADKNHVEPVDGLLRGDQIVVAGQAGLKDGALVRLPGDEDEDDGKENSGRSDEDSAVTRAGL